MKKTWLIIFFVLILLLPSIIADGTCQLDKFQYIPLETASLTCSCTLPNEESITGFIVWRNSTGFVLQNVSADSSSCRTSLFGNSFTFPVGANYTGNATFETNNANWGNAGDVVSDNFNVSGPNAFDCLIEEVVALREANLGELIAARILVENPTTGGGLVHAECQLDFYEASGQPLVFEPYEVGSSTRFAGSEGEVGFQHKFDERFWQTDMTYQFEIHCHCINETTHACYDETTGEDAGFKSCTATGLFNTSSIDNRVYTEDSSAGITIALFIFLATLLIFLLPKLFNNRFSDNEFSNLLLIRGFYIIGFYLMVMNSGIIAEIAINAGYSTKELFRYMWLFGWGGYLLMFATGIKTLFFDIPKMYQDAINKKRGFD